MIEQYDLESNMNLRGTSSLRDQLIFSRDVYLLLVIFAFGFSRNDPRTSLIQRKGGDEKETEPVQKSILFCNYRTEFVNERLLF